MTSPRARLESERGSGLVTSLLVIGIMMSIALPLLSIVDTQQRVGAGARLTESSFNLTDAVLNAQVFVLSNSWPATVDQAYPSCTQDAVSLKCPDPSAIAATYSGVDYSPASWQVRVRDDGASGDYYDPAVVGAQPAWDANANGTLWVRADARGTGPTRSIVAQVKLSEHVETFPRNVVTAGHITLKKKAKKKTILTLGSSAQPAPVAVRCTGTYGSTCLNYKPKKKWIEPNIVQTGYTGNALPPAAIDRLRQRAKMLGTYYPTCPASPVGALVFVESGNCTYAGDKKKSGFGTIERKGGRVAVNSPDSPGVFVIANGSVTFTKKLTYYGMVYAANLSNQSGDLITLLKQARIQGAVAADGDGGISFQASKTNLIFDENVFWSIRSLQGATVVQGSWREL